VGHGKILKTNQATSPRPLLSEYNKKRGKVAGKETGEVTIFPAFNSEINARMTFFQN
jgi:hypothetical protein